MRKILSRVFLLSALLTTLSALADQPDRLTQMFVWWNRALKTPGGFTVESFGQYWDKDAALVINGTVLAQGIEAITQSFKSIQERSVNDEIEIVVPFMQQFQAGDKIFTYHTIRSRRDGKAACMLASGYAELKNDKILVVNLVRADIDPATAPAQLNCWK